MTDEEWNTLESVSDVLIAWNKNKYFRSHAINHQKPRIEWLCQQFGIPPVNWACGGCIKNRLTSLYNFYINERTRRETTA